MRRKRVIVGTMMGLALVSAVVAGYMQLVQNVIYEESCEHLEEIYSQVSASFENLVTENWNLLDCWSHQIDHHGAAEPDEAGLAAFLHAEREKWGFTDFYFIDKRGNYVTSDGERGFFNLAAHEGRVMVEGANAVIDAMQPNGSALAVFAAPARDGWFRGFPYEAIAVGYDAVDMEDALDVSAFRGTSRCYVAYPDGRILLSAKAEENQPEDFFAELAARSNLGAHDIERVKDALNRGGSGVEGYRLDGVEHYLVYRPVGFQDWMMLGVVPVDTVNASLGQIQWATIGALVIALVPLGLVIVLVILRRNRRNLDAKELAIEYREELLSILVSNTDDIYIMFSPDGCKVEYVSPNIEKLLGIPVDDVREDIRSLSVSAVDPSNEPDLDAVAKLRKGDCLQRYNERVRKSTGERRWYQETLYCASIKGVDKYMLVLSDRTEERTNSLLLEQALDIARSSNEAKSLFLANMSHDIRTPINAIVGMTKIARESGEATDKIMGCLDSITMSSRHLLDLINDVLDMSRIESGQLELQERRFDLDDVVAEFDAIIRPQAEAKHQALSVDCSNVQHRMFAGDELRISQIMLNLASNAVKYTHEGGSIAFEVRELRKTRPSYAKMMFAVADNGMGMTPEFVERIFDPFERSEEAATSQIQGTGLGMSITKALIDAMGGIVDIESEPGRGSVFRVTLELRIAPAAAASAEFGAPETTAYSFVGKRYLLAEDNELNAEILIELLRHRGATVEWAENGEEAVRMLAKRPIAYYDAVFMDVMMPVMNGYDAARAMRASYEADLKIIALTANAFAEDVKTALDAGMDAHIAKPVDIDGLACALGKLCS